MWPAIVAVRCPLKFRDAIADNLLEDRCIRSAQVFVSTASVQRADPSFPVRHALTFCQLLETTVSIAGDDLSGESFVDECNTIAVAHDGLIVRIARSLALEQEIFVRRKNR